MARKKSQPSEHPKPAKGKGGRPTKAKPDAKKTILASLAKGNTVACAAALAGVDESSVYEWVRKGRRLGPNDPDPDGFRQFAHAYRESRAKAEAAVVDRLHLAARAGDVKAGQWWLERRRMKAWGSQKEEVANLKALVADLAQQIAALQGARPADVPAANPPADGATQSAGAAVGGGADSGSLDAAAGAADAGVSQPG